MDIENSAPNIEVAIRADIDDDRMAIAENSTNCNIIDNELHVHNETHNITVTQPLPLSTDECNNENKDNCDSSNLENGSISKDDSGDESIEYADAVDEEGACFFSLAPEMMDDHTINKGKYLYIINCVLFVFVRTEHIY